TSNQSQRTFPYIQRRRNAQRRDLLLTIRFLATHIPKKKKMAEEGQVISCTTVEIWKEKFESASQSKKLAVVDFTASWCGPCRFIAPVLADLAKKMPNVLFLKVDVDELREFEVEAMPTFIFFKEGKIVGKVIGARKEELVAGVEKHAAIEVASA
ncbi:Thioredoxin H1, partial [Linum perenne]